MLTRKLLLFFYSVKNASTSNVHNQITSSTNYMRASLYPAISQFVVDFCMKFTKGEKVPVVGQVGGRYRRQMDEETIETVKMMIDKECF